MKDTARKWKPASEKMTSLFLDLSTGLGEPKKMFGYPCAFINGNMYAGLHEAGLILRLNERERKELMELGRASQFEPMPGRIMREYVVLSEEAAGKKEFAEKWLRKAFEYASSLPEKEKKDKKK